MTDERRNLRILIAFPSSLQQSGGMEHACCSLASALQGKGHTVQISVLYGGVPKLFYELNSEVSLSSFMWQCKEKFHSPYIGRCIPLWGKIIREMLRPVSRSHMTHWNEWGQARLLRDSIRREVREFVPDVILSFSVKCTYFLMYALSARIPVITSLRFNPDHLLKSASKTEIGYLNKSAAVHVLMPSFVKKIKKYGVNCYVRDIPLAIPQYPLNVSLEKHKSLYRIINVARINRLQKRQHLLVEAFSMLEKDFPDWRVELWGEEHVFSGNYTNEIRQFIRSHHLEQKVLIRGVTQTIEKEYESADIFCFPSAFKGFGNALGEAMSAGLPAVGCRSCPAVNELIHNGENGFLADDSAESLAKSLRVLMQDQDLRVRMGRRAHEMMKAYSADLVYKKWEDLLMDAVKYHGRGSCG